MGHATRSGVNTKQTLQVLVPLALSFGAFACGPQQTPPPRAPEEAQSTAPVEAYTAPSGPVVTTETPVTPEMRTSMATPKASPKRSADAGVEASGPMTEPQRVVMSAVALCMQSAVDKGAKLGDRSLIVNVTVDTSGAVSAVDIDGAPAAIKACAEPEVRKVRYPRTDESGGMRVMQYPISASVQDASASDDD